MTSVGNKKPNRLVASSSPYLLQHAYNPVDWHEWGAEALDKARKQDKPILVSIGYSACHWCHVMERESFENEDIAAIMNAHFVCIKIDREERPDLDQIYMEAVQAMQMHGGWPLNVFLTPDQIPFYGGTYFPPRNWSQLLNGLEKAFRERRTEIEKSAEALKEHLQASDVDRFARDPGDEAFSLSNLDKMFHVLQSRFDHTWGGIEKAPKFVLPSIWLFLLRYYQISQNPDALSMVELTLKKMTTGGLLDVVGGGFSRYSVDGHWFAPHFEKMLYDNAQLLSLYAEAFSVTHEPEFKWIVSETVKWIESEMINSEGGVYSALDADSEGVEGKFYTWTWDEISQQLDEPMLEYFGITREGNWEHGRNILCSPGDINAFKINYQLKEGDIEHFLSEARKKLAVIRSKRIRPGLDDKILSGWNAMLVQGLVDSYRALDDEKYLSLALRIMNFVARHLISDGRLFRAYRLNHSGTEGFLEDYAFLIQAYISLYEVTFDETLLKDAKKWCDYTLENFFDREVGFFSFTSIQAEKLIARKKEIFDNVIPSSNSVMARNLLRLGTILDKADWIEKSKIMMRSLVTLTAAEPGSMSNWGILLAEITKGLSEIVIVGKNSPTLRRKLHKKYIPLSVTMGAVSKSDLPHFEGRESVDERTLIYVCRNKVCQLPVDTIDSALQQVNE